MQKFKIIKILFIVVVAIVVVVFLFALNKQIALSPNDNISDNTNNIVENLEIFGNKDDLISFSIKPGQEVSGIQEFNGVLKGGYFWEGNVLINILDINKKVLKFSYADATTDWMTSGLVDFEGSIDFSGLEKGIAYFEINEDDPSDGESGEPIKRILIPIVIK